MCEFTFPGKMRSSAKRQTGYDSVFDSISHRRAQASAVRKILGVMHRYMIVAREDID